MRDNETSHGTRTYYNLDETQQRLEMRNWVDNGVTADPPMVAPDEATLWEGPAGCLYIHAGSDVRRLYPNESDLRAHVFMAKALGWKRGDVYRYRLDHEFRLRSEGEPEKNVPFSQAGPATMWSVSIWHGPDGPVTQAGLCAQKRFASEGAIRDAVRQADAQEAKNEATRRNGQ